MSETRPIAFAHKESSCSTPLDLNELLVKHPAATFFVRVGGDAMVGAGLFPGDIAVVDRSLTPKKGSIIVAILNGEFTIRRLMKGKLQAENSKYKEIPLTPETDFQVWGVITYVIHDVLSC